MGRQPQAEREPAELCRPGPTPTAWCLSDLKDLPEATYEGPIHCVTRWTKFGLRFTGVSLDTLLDVVGVNPASSHVPAQAVTGYTSSLALDEVTTNTAWVVYSVDDQPLPTDHGGPLRLSCQTATCGRA